MAVGGMVVQDGLLGRIKGRCLAVMDNATVVAVMMIQSHGSSG